MSESNGTWNCKRCGIKTKMGDYNYCVACIDIVYKTHVNRINAEIIDPKAIEIMDRCKDSTIFGVPLDLDNINHVILGAYFQGQMDGAKVERDFYKGLLDI